MPSLLLRKYKTSEKVELQFESIADISIQELKENASSKLQIPLNDLSRLFDLWVLASLWDFNIYTELVYGGRILKAGKTAMDYKVVSGCTIYVMAVKPKKRENEVVILDKSASWLILTVCRYKRTPVTCGIGRRAHEE